MKLEVATVNMYAECTLFTISQLVERTWRKPRDDP
jgi:hypothetical protein